MKRYLYLILGSLIMLSCSEDELETFRTSQQYLFFSDSYADSSNYSFFYYPDADYLDIPIEIKLVGNISDTDRDFVLQVNKEESTVSSQHYMLPEKLIFRAGRVTDTVHLRINNSPDLRNKEVRLVLELVKNRFFNPGPYMHSRYVIRFSDIISQPEWWDQTVTETYLGDYSEKKFREFMSVTGIGDLSDASSDEIWHLSRMFKYYLQEMKNKGTPVIDEDGGYMEVPVIG